MKSHLLFLGASVALWAGAACADNAKVCFEAETPDHMESPLRPVKGQGNAVSGGGFLEIPWDQNKTKGVGYATYSIKAPKAGTYTLWARCYWANGCGNSIQLGTSKANLKLLGEDGTYDAWHWVGGKSVVALKKGKNNFVLHNHETGVRVDQIFLCTDPDYTPVGKRPITK